MSRTKGALNKPKPKKREIYNINLEKQIPTAPIIKRSGMDWVLWGSKNLYPYDLINLYNASITHKSCIDFAVSAIIGNGLDLEAMKIKDGDLQAPNYQMSWDEFLRQIAFDYCLYGGFAFQIIRNRGGETYSFYPQPLETVRVAERDEDGVITKAYLCKDWSEWARYGVIEMPIFGMQDDKTIPMGKPYLFYYLPYSPVNDYYPTPMYASGIKAIQSEIEYVNQDLKTIINGFCPAGALTLPAVETDAERMAIINNIQKMFQGSDNANSLMITFRTMPDEEPIQFTPFTMTSSDGVNMYADANERTISRIVAAHRVSNRALIGYSVDDSGFSDSGNLLQTAFHIYQINVANRNRQVITDTINSLFKMNGIDTQLILKPLNYSLSDDAPKEVEKPINENPIGEPTDEDEVTEKEVADEKNND